MFIEDLQTHLIDFKEDFKVKIESQNYIFLFFIQRQ